MEKIKPVPLEEFKQIISSENDAQLEERRKIHRFGKRFGVGAVVASLAIGYGAAVGVGANFKSEPAKAGAIFSMFGGTIGAAGAFDLARRHRFGEQVVKEEQEKRVKKRR